MDVSFKMPYPPSGGPINRAAQLIRESIQGYGDGPEASHFFFRLFAVIRVGINRPNGVLKQKHFVGSFNGILDRVEDTVVGGQTADKKTLNMSRT